MNAARTPRVVLSHARLLANIQTMAARAKAAGCVLRPHVKTHKCFEIARLQVEAGAVGVTASRAREVEAFLRGGAQWGARAAAGSRAPRVADVTMAFPVVDAAEAGCVLAAASEAEANGNVAVRLGAIVDSSRGADAWAAAAARKTPIAPVRLHVKVDVGLGRCGVREDEYAARLLPLVQHIERVSAASSRGVVLGGLLSHAGHTYGVPTAARVGELADEETARMRRLAERLEHDLGRNSGDRIAVSVGATPAELARRDYAGLHELRPGNYVFLDLACVRQGLAQLDDVALVVEATIVSENDEYWLCDAGSKTLSSDIGVHSSGAGGAITGYGFAFPHTADVDDAHNTRAWSLLRGALAGGAPPNSAALVARVSEEHGWIAKRGVAPETAARLAIGARVRIVPNHSCVVANLAARYYVEGASSSVEEWRVDARNDH